MGTQRHESNQGSTDGCPAPEDADRHPRRDSRCREQPRELQRTPTAASPLRKAAALPLTCERLPQRPAEDLELLLADAAPRPQQPGDEADGGGDLGDHVLPRAAALAHPGTGPSATGYEHQQRLNRRCAIYSALSALPLYGVARDGVMGGGGADWLRDAVCK